MLYMHVCASMCVWGIMCNTQSHTIVQLRVFNRESECATVKYRLNLYLYLKY